MKETEQAPRRFVGNSRVGAREHNRVDREKAVQRGFLAGERHRGPDGGQNQNQSFTPGRTFCRMKPGEPLEIKAPRMDMRGMSARALQPWKVRAR